jgi:hypothetical protein
MQCKKIRHPGCSVRLTLGEKQLCLLCLLPQAVKEVAFNVSQLYAAAANSSLVGFTTGRAGDPLVVVATLRSLLGRPVLVADNVRVTVTGELLVYRSFVALLCSSCVAHAVGCYPAS